MSPAWRCPVLLTLIPLAGLAVSRLAAQEPARRPQLLGAQFTAIGQDLLPFQSPYSGPNSLRPDGDQGLTHTYGLYGGWRVARPLELYLDVEMARGNGVSHATGLAGVTNGDVIRQGTADLSQGPFVARLFARWSISLGAESVRVERAQDQLPGWVPVRRIEIAAGKVAASDFFDVNRYANNTRLQFLNWGLFQNSAWDFAADTRGFTYGVVVGWITPVCSVRIGSFLMPTQANGNVFDTDWPRARGDNIEITMVPRSATTIRLLGYANHARMGNYRAAIAAAAGGTPDIVADDQPGRTKYGVGLNVEQALADDGETGAFMRAGWNDGRNESFAFTEVETHLSAGVQLAGSRWSRPSDRLALAVLRHGLLAPHRDYLAAGGKGFLLGDGSLNYGAEEIVEVYYRVQAGRFLEISPDAQYIAHPGYNRDRGPAAVITLRVNARY